MFQVIIQGLRESGVFSSVIASAPTMSKDKFLSSMGSTNSSRAVASQSLPSRKFGRSKESQATARKTLEIADTVSHIAAIPPLSPPGMDDEQLMFEAWWISWHECFLFFSFLLGRWYQEILDLLFLLWRERIRREERGRWGSFMFGFMGFRRFPDHYPSAGVNFLEKKREFW